MKAFEIAMMVIRLLPVILQAIRAVEEALPIPKVGSAKFATVLGIVETAYNSIAVTGTAVSSLPWASIAPAVGNIVNKLVGAFNANGWPVDSATPTPAQ